MSRGLQIRHLAVGVAVFVADQWTKGLIDRQPLDFSHTVIPGVFELVHAENPGVAFGMFQNTAPLLRDLLISGSSLVLLVILILLWRSKQSSRTGYAMALIAGGACGNLLDRVLHGKVVDFLLFSAGTHSWPVFNLADSAICVGAALLVWEILHDQSRVADAPAAAGAGHPAPPSKSANLGMAPAEPPDGVR